MRTEDTAGFRRTALDHAAASLRNDRAGDAVHAARCDGIAQGICAVIQVSVDELRDEAKRIVDAEGGRPRHDAPMSRPTTPNIKRLRVVEATAGELAAVLLEQLQADAADEEDYRGIAALGHAGALVALLPVHVGAMLEAERERG